MTENTTHTTREAIQYWYDAATERRQEIARLRAVLARIGQMADHWEQALPEVIRTPAVVSALRAALEPAAASAVRVPATDRTADAGDDEGDELVCVDECGFCDACGMEPFGTPAEGWREAARFLRRSARDSGDRQGALHGARLIEAELRRMAAAPAAAGPGRTADETQGVARCSAAAFKRPHGPHPWEPQPGMEPVRCPGACCCEHPDDEHSVYGCADDCPCEHLPARKKPPMDPVHILGIGADEEPAVPGWSGDDAAGEESEWCKCPSCWGWFVEDHPGEDLDELGKDLGWWSGLPEHRDASAVGGAQQADRIVGYRSPGGHYLYCPIHADRASWTPVTAEDLRDGGICTVCYVDVLIEQQPKEA